jgi:hypothetical protein
MMASLSKWKQMAVVLLNDLLAVVKGRMGVARHDDALATTLHSLPRLSSRSDGQQLMGPCLGTATFARRGCRGAAAGR